MKKYYFVITIVLLWTSMGFSQCNVGNLTLGSQYQVNDFIINNPGCTELGDLFIYGSDITNLNGLINIQKVNSLVILNVPNLTDYTGLNNLTNTTGAFSIQGTTGSSISGFSNLTSVGAFDISGITVSSFSGFSNLTSVGSSFGFSNCTASTISGFNKLVSIGGYLVLQNNPNLISINGMDNVVSIQGLYVYNNSTLTTIPGAVIIDTDAYISNNNALTSLSGLNKLTTINGNFLIFNNQNLSSLTGLNSLSSIGGPLQIQNNDSLLNLSGLNNLTTINGVNGTLYITDNQVLNSIAALENLESINGTLAINNNSSLTSLSGLDNIYPTSIKSFQLYSNNQLSICNVQSICSHLEIYYNLPDIHDNLPGCATIEEIRVACSNVNHSTYGSVSPTVVTECANATVDISISGMVPNSMSTVSYNINNESTIKVLGVSADGSGNGNFSLLLSALYNGQTLTITAIERTDIASGELSVTANNTVSLNINNSGNVEVEGNGIDDNCSGVIDEIGPKTKLTNKLCGSTLKSLRNTIITANQIKNATAYRFEVTNGTTINTYDSPIRSFDLLNLFGGIANATTYSIRVSVKVGGFWQAYGSICTITTPVGTSKITDVNEKPSVSSFFNVKVYPNPTKNLFNLVIEGGSNEKIVVTVYDIFGRKVNHIEKSDGQSILFGEKLPRGYYTAIIKQGANQQTVKLIKQE
jgi:hypothetical protein